MSPARTQKRSCWLNSSYFFAKNVSHASRYWATKSSLSLKSSLSPLAEPMSLPHSVSARAVCAEAVVCYLDALLGALRPRALAGAFLWGVLAGAFAGAAPFATEPLFVLPFLAGAFFLGRGPA